MSTTYTFSGTDTYSVSDVKAVMQNTFEDIIGFANRGLITYDQAKSFIDDLTYILKNKALKAFEIQLNQDSIRYKSYRYVVGVAGYISSGDLSGGINYWSLPADTVINFYAELDKDSTSYSTVLHELQNNRRWGSNGSAMEGNSQTERNYVSNSLQLKRSVITS